MHVVVNRLFAVGRMPKMDAIIPVVFLTVDEGDLNIRLAVRREEAGAKRFDRAMCSNNRNQPLTVFRKDYRWSL